MSDTKGEHFNAYDELRFRFPQDSRAEWRRKLQRLERGQCPGCGGPEWLPGGSCWHCGFEMPPRAAQP